MSRETWIAIGVAVAVIGVVTLYFAIRLIIKLFATKRMLGDLGTGGKIAFWGAILYTIFPIDLLPDPIYLDDMAVLGGALALLTSQLRKRGGLKGVIPRRGAPQKVTRP
jgi:uncharacterized membrane protein YkvA (DUF1232 family)